MNIKSCHCVYTEFEPGKTGVEIVFYSSLRELLSVELLRMYYGDESAVFKWLGDDALSIAKSVIKRFHELDGKGALSFLWYLSNEDLTCLFTTAFAALGTVAGRRRMILIGELSEEESYAVKERHIYVAENERQGSYCNTNCPVGYLFRCDKFANGEEKQLVKAESFGKALNMLMAAEFFTYSDMCNVITTIAQVLHEDKEILLNAIEFLLINRFLQARKGTYNGDTYGCLVRSIGGSLHG